MEHLAVIAGILGASFTNPVFLVMLALAGLCALAPGRVLVFVVVAAVASFVRVQLFESARASLGLGSWAYQEHLFIANFLAMAVVFGLAVLVGRLRQP